MSYRGLSQVKLKAYTKDRIIDIGKCDSLKNEYPNDFDFFVNYLFPRHPKYPAKVDNLQDVIINYNKFGILSVYFTKHNGEIEDISALKKCISGKNADDLYISMRNAILPQILEYKGKQKSLVCELCDNRENIEVDHKYPHFIDLFSDFINQEQYKPILFSSDKYHRKILTEKDKDFEVKWIDYHEQYCSLRLLCKKCNSSRVKHSRNLIINR